MTKNKNKVPIRSKISIALGIILTIFTPFWFNLGMSMEKSPFGFITAVVYGVIVSSIWLLMCFGIIAYGVSKYSKNKI